MIYFRRSERQKSFFVTAAAAMINFALRPSVAVRYKLLPNSDRLFAAKSCLVPPHTAPKINESVSNLISFSDAGTRDSTG